MKSHEIMENVGNTYQSTVILLTVVIYPDYHVTFKARKHQIVDEKLPKILTLIKIDIKYAQKHTQSIVLKNIHPGTLEVDIFAKEWLIFSLNNSFMSIMISQNTYVA